MTPAEAVRRIESARQYFQFLMGSSSVAWTDLEVGYRAGQLSLQQAATLVHPRWLPDGLVTSGRSVRAFGGQIPNYERCHSQELWGYDCAFERTLETDHLFPWSLGGPTHPENAVYLCANHNRA